jgi:hypothetical protein
MDPGLDWLPMAHSARRIHTLLELDHPDRVRERMQHEQAHFPYLLKVPGACDNWRCFRDRFARRGLVFTVGSMQVKSMLPLMHMLRREFNVTLPIEVFYMGEHDFPARQREHFLKARYENVRLISLWSVLNQTYFEDMDGYCAKPLAVLASSFSEVLFLDSDVVALQDPTLLFEDPEYKSTGWMFFRELSMLGPPPDLQYNYPHSLVTWIKAFVPQLDPRIVARSRSMSTNHTSEEIESSLFAYHKSHHLVALLAAVKMCDAQYSREFHFRFHGDREAFWLGAVIVNEFPALMPYENGLVGHAMEKSGTYCGIPLHTDRDGVPFHLNGGVLFSKYDHSLGPVNFSAWALIHATQPEQFLLPRANLAELGGSRWPPHIYLAGHCVRRYALYPVQPLQARRMEAQYLAQCNLMQTQPFWFELGSGRHRNAKLHVNELSMLPYRVRAQRNYHAAHVMNKSGSALAPAAEQ